MISVVALPKPGLGIQHSPLMKEVNLSRGKPCSLPFRPMVGDVLDVGDGWDNYVTEVHIDVTRGYVIVIVSPDVLDVAGRS